MQTMVLFFFVYQALFLPKKMRHNCDHTLFLSMLRLGPKANLREKMC